MSIKYYLRLNKRLNLNNPSTFNEKLQWLKLYGRKPIDTILSDKFAVKEYISEKIGSQYVIPLYGVWDRFEDIDFNRLPESFVLKCTHDSGGIVICKDKGHFDIPQARARIKKCLQHDFYVYSREKAYKNIPRRIIAEKYMEDVASTELRDYKFFCFDGTVKFFKIDFGRFSEHHANYYSPDCELLEWGEETYPPKHDVNLTIPDNIQEMISLAEILSAGFPFIRVDFYDVNGHVLFGEFTFSPAGGMGAFTKPEIDFELGKMIDISKVRFNLNNNERN